MINKKWITSPILLFSFLGNLLACMCGDINVENDSLENYDELFLGKLISAKHVDKVAINDRVSFPAEIDEFEIIKSWKGELNQGEKTSIYQFGIGCTNHLSEEKTNSKIIIGAYYNRDWSELQGIEKFLQTDLCSLILLESDEIAYKKAMQILNTKYSKKTIKNNHKTKFAIIALSILLIIVIAGYSNKNRFLNQ